MNIHYTENYLLNPAHRVTVDLVGMGGTGSQVLTMLGRMSSALINLGQPGLHVRAWDPDTVSDANIGRQMFSPSDIGQNKAVCLISRVNRFFGTDWEAWPILFHENEGTGRDTSNITISCVDSIASRIATRDFLKEHYSDLKKRSHDNHPLYIPYYWMDYGNGQQTGQVLLSTIKSIEQPKKVTKGQSVKGSLPDVFTLFPSMLEQKEEDSGPSCSLAEALTKQDLFINSTLCNLGMAILWKLFREMRITHHGAFLNLDTLSVNPIKI